MAIIAASLLAANFADLTSTMQTLEKSKAEWLHIDVMDGQFVSNLSFGACVFSKLRPISTKFFDVHLMVNEPSHLFLDMVNAGADMITVHVEACQDIKKDIAKIKALGIKVGISLKPNTPVKDIEPYLEDVDHVLLMSVEPGLGGQLFIENSFAKLEQLVKLKCQYNFTIAVDGGVNELNIKQVINAGADVAVMGTAIFKELNFNKIIDKFYNKLN